MTDQQHRETVDGRWRNTNAVITGASSGIGRAIAVELSRRGVQDLVIHYRNNHQGAEETAQLVAKCGTRPHILQADLALNEDVDDFTAQAFQTLGTVQTWINNAGLDVLTGDASEWPFQQKLEQLLKVDLVGTIRLSRIAASRMIAQTNQSPPSMIFLGWDQAPAGMEGDAGQMFGPVKAAVMAFANSLAQDSAPHLRVNTVAPGWIQTAWGNETSEYWDRRAKSQSLMSRWGTPQDVASAVAALADPASEFLTGQCINVNGGWSRRFDAPPPQ